MTDGIVRRINDLEARIIVLESEMSLYERQVTVLKQQQKDTLATVDRLLSVVEQLMSRETVNPPPQGDE